MAKFISQIKLFIILTILTIPIGLNSVVGADGVPFATDPDINQMPNATYTYASAALACYNSLEEVEGSKNMAVRMLEHAKKYRLLTKVGEWAYSNLTTFIEDGATAYKASAYVTCGEVSGALKV